MEKVTNILLRVLLNLLLVVIATALAIVLLPIGFIWGLIASFINVKPLTGFKYLADSFLSIAVSIDQLGNVVCARLFNFVLIKDDFDNPFGNPDETISSVLGKNKLSENLTFVGKALSSLLDALDKNHSIKSIEKDEMKPNAKNITKVKVPKGKTMSPFLNKRRPLRGGGSTPR